MSESINAEIREENLSAVLETEPEISAQLALEAQLGADMTPGSIILDDYQLTIEPIEGGNRLIVKRGSEVKTLDILNGANVKEITITEVV